MRVREVRVHIPPLARSGSDSPSAFGHRWPNIRLKTRKVVKKTSIAAGTYAVGVGNLQVRAVCPPAAGERDGDSIAWMVKRLMLM
mmetsp:Transcript_85613/g.242766  ORF Transcript_85613/g.242766 Transcript_85613/m.242766 type:complete len:85 (-) Transcript_85613:1147-1401(-)